MSDAGGMRLELRDGAPAEVEPADLGALAHV